MKTQSRFIPTALVCSALLLGLLVPLSVQLRSAQGSQYDPKKGKNLFERRCTGCHSLDDVRIGPRLRNIFGSQAAAQHGFSYSDALKAEHFTWNESTLDRWLTDTESLVPDNDMAFRLSDSAERGAIIAYLKSLSAAVSTDPTAN